MELRAVRLGVDPSTHRGAHRSILHNKDQSTPRGVPLNIRCGILLATTKLRRMVRVGLPLVAMPRWATNPMHRRLSECGLQQKRWPKSKLCLISLQKLLGWTREEPKSSASSTTWGRRCMQAHLCVPAYLQHHEVKIKEERGMP